jgi:hypothetical protein
MLTVLDSLVTSICLSVRDLCVRGFTLLNDLPSDMEPLLMESKRRFVLFPIQYQEVRGSSFNLSQLS